MKIAPALLSILAIIGSPLAAQTVQVPARGEQKIDQHGFCRVVKNAGNIPVMVPTRSAAEWSSGSLSFMSNFQKIPGVTVDTCGGRWIADAVCSVNGKGNCVFIEWWMGAYIVVVDGEIDRACFNPGSRIRGANVPLTAADKASWEDYGKNVHSYSSYGAFRGMYKYLNDLGFLDEALAKADYFCNIKPGFDAWYNSQGNDKNLAEIFSEPSYPWKVGKFITQNPPYFVAQDQAEVWIYELDPK